MIKALIVDSSKINCGNEAFDDGDIVEILSFVESSENRYADLFSEKLNRSYRVYSNEYDSFELTIV